MTKDIPKAIRVDTVHVAGIPIEVAVLNDGTRVIEQHSFERIMEAMGAGTLTPEDVVKISNIAGGQAHG